MGEYFRNNREKHVRHCEHLTNNTYKCCSWCGQHLRECLGNLSQDCWNFFQNFLCVVVSRSKLHPGTPDINLHSAMKASWISLSQSPSFILTSLVVYQGKMNLGRTMKAAWGRKAGYKYLNFCYILSTTEKHGHFYFTASSTQYELPNFSPVVLPNLQISIYMVRYKFTGIPMALLQCFQSKLSVVLMTPNIKHIQHRGQKICKESPSCKLCFASQPPCKRVQQEKQKHNWDIRRSTSGWHTFPYTEVLFI